MQRPVFIFILVICFISSNRLKAQVIFNGDLEKIDPKTNMPVAWTTVMKGGYRYQLDSNTVKHGKYAISITSNDTAPYGAINCVLPYNFTGSTLQLKGFIKTENVTNGYAGIWMRVNGIDEFDKMEKQNLHGTNDWKEYTISMPYNSEVARSINVGGLLTGKGKMWFDNLRLYIDGKLITKLPYKPVVEPPAK
ncbi:hypothetical protein [Mucilaginibacter sp. UYCu711]|uniref:hypothetical protein n=1 Tax=Mucilaginibacter sp. UYCu711 TaxID=3156339 RepID=UPI003D1BEC31